jgi:hypothetical protein
MFRILLTVLLFSFSLIVAAETCPSAQSIKNHSARNWRAFDSDTGKPLEQARENLFRNEITQFALAEWSGRNNSNIHCYYKNEDGSHLEAYFARTGTSIARPSKYWYEVTGMMRCAAGTEKCKFSTLPGDQHQLAQNE